MLLHEGNTEAGVANKDGTASVLSSYIVHPFSGRRYYVHIGNACGGVTITPQWLVWHCKRYGIEFNATDRLDDWISKWYDLKLAIERDCMECADWVMRKLRRS